jgi:hypothetical protein
VAQGQNTLEAAWGEVEKAQSLESAWAEVEAKKAPIRTAFRGEPVPQAQAGSGRAMAAGAIEGFAKLPELFERVQTAIPRAIGRQVGVEWRKGPTAREVQEAIVPVPDEARETAPYQIGAVAGGLAQMPILGPGGLPAVAAGFGGQTGMTAYDDAKANGASELEAWTAAGAQGGLSALTVAATAKLATRWNVNSGGLFARIAKNIGLGVPTGTVEQTISNGLTKYTKEADRETFTGLKGRAATDAAVGLVMTAFFPGHKPSKRVQAAADRAVPKLEPARAANPPASPEGSPAPVQLVGMEGVTAKDLQGAVEHYGEKGASYDPRSGKSVGAGRVLRIASEADKLWENMTPQERTAEFQASALKDLEIAAKEATNPVDYLLDRALDPLDPMAGLYKAILKAQGAQITEKGGIKLSPALERWRQDPSLGEISPKLLEATQKPQAAAEVEATPRASERAAAGSMSPEQHQALLKASTEEGRMPTASMVQRVLGKGYIEARRIADEFNARPAPVEPAKPPEVHPLEAVVQEMNLTNLRIRNLEGQSRHAKQKGKTEKGFEIDKELLKLKDKLRDQAAQFQEIAAAERGPEEAKAVENIPPTIPTPDAAPAKQTSASEPVVRATGAPDLSDLAHFRDFQKKDPEAFARIAGPQHWPEGAIQTGRPVTIEGFHGSGRADKAAAYAPGAEGAILGDALYLAPSEAVAKGFGPKVEKIPIRLENPLVITNSRQLGDILNRPLPRSLGEIGPFMREVRKAIEAAGYDGVIVNLPSPMSDMPLDKSGGGVKVLREYFDRSQIIAFKKPATAQVEAPTPKAAKPAPKPKQSIGQKAKLRAETSDLQTFVASLGGIRGDTPEGRLLHSSLGEKEAGKKFGLGPIIRSPKSIKGLNWEHAKEQAFEQGYFPEHASSGDITFREFADALTENRKHPEGLARAGESEAQYEARRRDEADAAQQGTPEEIAAFEKMRADEEAAAAAAQKAEFDRIAAEDPERAALMAEGQAEDSSMSFDPASWEEDLGDSIKIQGLEPPIAEHYVRSVKAVSDELGEPPGPPKPPMSSDAMPEPGDPAGVDLIGTWIGQRQLAHAHADLKGGLWRRALDKTLQGGFGRFAKERFLPRGKRARDLIEEAGQLDIDLRGKIDDEYGKFGGQLSDEHRAVLERMAKLSPGQRRVIDEAIASNRKLSKLALDETVISNYYDIYTKRLWQGSGASEAEVRNQPKGPAKFTTFTTGALPRSYSSILEGWANGNELRVKSFVDAAVQNEKTIADVIANRNFIDQMRKVDRLRTVNPGEGWEQIKHPNFTDEVLRARIAAPDSAETLRDSLSGHLDEAIPLEEAIKVYGRAKEGKGSIVAGRDMRIIPRGDDILILQKMPLFARKADARIINNVLGRSGISEWFEQGTPAGKALSSVDKYGVVAKTMMTASIQDNVVFTAMRNFRASPANSPADVLTLKPYLRGTKMIRSWGPDLQRGISEGGLVLRPSADVLPFFELEKGRVSKSLDKLKVVGPAKAFIENAYIDLNSFLYGKFIPAYKAHLYSLELARLRKVNHEKLMTGAMSDSALVKAAAQLSNNVFGGQNWQRMGANPTAMHAAQHAVFAPDRMTSTLRLASDAFRAGATGEAHRVLWTRMMSRYVFAWAAMNLASAWADDPEHPVDNFAKRAKENYGVGLREFFGFDISPILQRAGRDNPSRLYVDITAQSNEAIDLVNDPLRYLGRKTGIVPRMVVSALTGEDYFGRQYTTISELAGVDDKGLYKTTRLPHHVAGMQKGGQLEGQISSYQSDAKAGAISYGQMPSFLIGHIPVPLELESWLEVVQGQTDAYDALLTSMGLRVMAPSKKRQDAAGIRPELNLETLFR